MSTADPSFRKEDAAYKRRRIAELLAKEPELDNHTIAIRFRCAEGVVRSVRREIEAKGGAK